MTSQSWRRSPWDADPLSWFTTPNLPLAAAGIILVSGATALGYGQAGAYPLVQWGALGLAVLAPIWVHLVTRPRRGAFSAVRGLVAVAFSSAALVLSALGYSGEELAVESWWAPLAASLVLLALVPYSSAVRLGVLGLVLLAVGFVTTFLFVVPVVQSWPAASAVAITLLPIAVGTVGGVVIIHAITLALGRWSERPLEAPGIRPTDDDLVASVDDATSARIASATEFIAAVLARGTITAGDTLRATAIAERLRGELRGEIDRTWIERVAEGRAVSVDDPDRLAESLDLAQRTAMRALLDALLGDAHAGVGSARVELRRTGTGAIAVALRIMTTLPEGRRETFLAPYYVSLKSAVDRLTWRNGPITAVEFEVAAPSGERASVQRTPEPGTPGGPIAR